MATTFQGEDIYINILFCKLKNRAGLPSYQSFFSRCNNYVQQKAGLLSNNQPETTNQKLGPHKKTPPLTEYPQPCPFFLMYEMRVRQT